MSENCLRVRQNGNDLNSAKPMKKLIPKMSVSVDGFVGGPKGEIDWIFSTLSKDATKWEVDTLWDASLHLMGSRTYHDMAAWWPTSKEVFAPPNDFMSNSSKVCLSSPAPSRRFTG
jgi:dihydrofolate reductase